MRLLQEVNKNNYSIFVLLTASIVHPLGGLFHGDIPVPCTAHNLYCPSLRWSISRRPSCTLYCSQSLLSIPQVVCFTATFLYPVLLTISIVHPLGGLFHGDLPVPCTAHSLYCPSLRWSVSRRPSCTLYCSQSLLSIL